MPTYDYICNSCNNTFEVHQKMTDMPITVCPQCGGTVRQVFSAGFGLKFNGGGFYTTDTKKGSAGSQDKKETASQEAAAQSVPSSCCSGSCGCSCCS